MITVIILCAIIILLLCVGFELMTVIFDYKYANECLEERIKHFENEKNL